MAIDVKEALRRKLPGLRGFAGELEEAIDAQKRELLAELDRAHCLAALIARLRECITDIRAVVEELPSCEELRCELPGLRGFAGELEWAVNMQERELHAALDYTCHLAVYLDRLQECVRDFSRLLEDADRQ